MKKKIYYRLMLLTVISLILNVTFLAGYGSIYGIFEFVLMLMTNVAVLNIFIYFYIKGVEDES